MHIGILGPFEVRLDDGALAEVPGARLRGLLAALALDAGRAVPKSALVDWIWGEQPPADAANALQQLVSRLRKALPEGTIEARPDGYRLRLDPDAVDALRFERLVTHARDHRAPHLLREALALWRGAALQDAGLPESPALAATVTRLEALRLTAMEDRFDADIALGHGAELVTELTDAVAAHPVRERLVAALMRALVATGRDTEALRVFERTREILADDLGVDPSAELSDLHLALLRGELGGRDNTLKPHRHTNLRAEITSFVGKQADIAGVRELSAEYRLTTLIGPGGTGKTRLATETARTLLGDLPDGVWLVELAAVEGDSANNVAQATLTALGLRDALIADVPGAEPADRVAAAIRDKSMLLVLDNCEHVIESAAAFAHRVLGECRGLRIIATSREPLGITGEALWPVSPLTLPQPDAGPAEIEDAPAVQLLRARAVAIRKDLATDAGTSATLARVCRALDGMPLAIELAAARLRTMSLDQLATRLDDRFRLLTGGSRTALPRHRTLRAVIDWSWELLTDDERAVLRRFAVFAGGANLESAERICGGAGVDPGRVLDLLTALTEKSLLLTEGDRYHILGTLREYAAQRLAEAGETESARRAHLAYFTAFAETADPHLRRAEQLDWLAALDADHDNIAAAMRGALAAGAAGDALRLAAAAGWYWWLGGHKAEANELIMAATALPGEVADDIRAIVYAFVIQFVTSGPQSDQYRAADWIHKAHEHSSGTGSRHPVLRFVTPLARMLSGPEEVLPAWEALLAEDDPWVRALGRLQLGKLRVQLGRGIGDAETDLAAALAEFRALGERWGIAFARTELANLIAMRGEFAAACDHYERAIEVVTELGAVEDVVPMRSRQAQLYWLAGDADACAAAMAAAQRGARRVAWPNVLAELALAEAKLARWRGDTERARSELATATDLMGEEAEGGIGRTLTHDLLGYLTDDLDRARAHRAAAYAAASETGHPLLIAQALVGIADQALREEDHARAARLLGASVAVRGAPDLSQPDAARIETDTRNRLGDNEFTEAIAEGARADRAELVAATLAC